ncbi:MAG: CDP-alcohol phosphatidyltransferase family protein, partial [Burkholderiaceae bacterium]
HAVARWFVRPLVGTWVRPNHLTWLRMFIGLAAAGLLVLGSAQGDLWSGICWTIACFLDRADGELARVGDLRSESGKRLDYYADVVLDAAWFAAAGIGLRHGSLGMIAPALGLLCCASMVLVQWSGEMYERLSGPGVKVWAGVRRFHPDDALFLLAALTWLHVLEPVLLGSSVGVPVVGIVTYFRYRALRARMKDGRSGREGDIERRDRSGT